MPRQRPCVKTRLRQNNRHENEHQVNREKSLDTPSTPDVTPIVAGPVKAVEVAAAEQIAAKPTRIWRA